MGWDMRSRLYLLQKTEKVLREIRNLDSQVVIQFTNFFLVECCPLSKFNFSIFSFVEKRIK